MSSASTSSGRDLLPDRDPLRVRIGDSVIRFDGNRNASPVDDTPRAYSETPTTGILPGFGEENDECGEPIPHFCRGCGRVARDDHGEVAQIGQTCWRKECPRCANGWALRRSYAITAKMESLRKQIHHETSSSPRFHHVVISFEDESFAAAGDPDEALWEVAKRTLDRVTANYHGAALIHHPYRGLDGDDRDKWKSRLFSNREWEGDVRDELKESHHIHALVLADSVDHLLSEANYDDTGIVVHRVEKENSNVSLYDLEDLASATTYALSHARVSENADAYRYTGRLANHSSDAQTEAQAKAACRSVARQTLDLDLSILTCQHADEDAPSDQPQFDGAGDGASAAAEPSVSKCGQRLVPIRFAPKYLDRGDLDHENELRREYQKWDGAPPPD